MKRSWVVLLAVALLSALAGVAIAGRPYSVDTTVIDAPTVVAAETTTLSPETSTTVRPETSTTVRPAAAPSTSSSPNTTSSPTTTTIEASLNRSAIRVVVANATNRPGVAGSTALVLVAAGFTDSKPIDALENSVVTVVYVRPGFEAAAADLASTLGLAAATVQPLETTAITTGDSNADLIVVIGDDFQS